MTTRPYKPLQATRFCLANRNTNTTAQKSSIGWLRLHGYRAIWGAVRWFLATQTSNSGNQFNQIALAKLCGDLRAARSDRAVNEARFKVSELWRSRSEASQRHLFYPSQSSTI